jgi:hypothetical protein
MEEFVFSMYVLNELVQTHMMPHQMITPPSSPQLVDLLLPQQAMDARNIQPRRTNDIAMRLRYGHGRICI